MLKTVNRAPFAAAFVLGFAFSGFFDGVLLHQILQWHHLLSLVEVDAVQSLHVQILADGLFHALMYLVALVGLLMLWRARDGLAAAGGSRRLWGGVFLGFGAWNVVDVGLFIIAVLCLRPAEAGQVRSEQGSKKPRGRKLSLQGKLRALARPALKQRRAIGSHSLHLENQTLRAEKR